MGGDKGRPGVGGLNACRGLPQLKSFGGLLIDRLPELVVHASAPDIVLNLHLVRRVLSRPSGEGRVGERRVSAEVRVEEFALDRPAVAQRVFDAATDCVTAASLTLLVAGCYPTDRGPFRRVDFCTRAAA